MHKLYEYACDELKELEKKADKGLSAAELEYADKLTELKKIILKIEMLEDEGYSAEYRDDMGRSYRYDDGRSYARGRRDSMGRYSRNYSRAANEIVDQLKDMIPHAPDEKAKRDIRELIDKMENA